ncbi:hypothetical protein Pla175_37590 [Pirellulimonas nuda]|uniref:LTXXQ motif protein n=1 Tax=Pirellulimonas nuda TaxID=2528009 RepID=A0A518DFU7_9BACT|nr:hypothetical protein [Pirellulimonas nuda]QDU90355.1 hypothetical protein Pla175_37590 [Pirellulimonas nuda]
MSRLLIFPLLIALAAVAPRPALGQPGGGSPNVDAASDASRNVVLESDRWRQARRQLDEWLSVQQLYTQDEVTRMRQELSARIAKMSAGELMTLLEDMEGRIAALASPEAAQARMWLNQFLPTQSQASQDRLRAKRPDVLNMTGSQIRMELDRFQQRRVANQQSQAAFDRARQTQNQSIQSMRADQNQAQADMRDARSRAAQQQNQRLQDAQLRGPYAPANQMRSPWGGGLDGRPLYTVGPWGAPIHFNPLYGGW